MFGSWANRLSLDNPVEAGSICGSYDGCNIFVGRSIGSVLLFSSSNSGESWIQEPTTAGYIVACGSNSDRRIFHDPNTATLQLTLDAGATYSTFFEGFTSNYYTTKDIAVSHSLSTAYIVQSTLVFRTRDMGVSWTGINLNFESGLSIACSSNGQNVAVIARGTTDSNSSANNDLYYTSDYGSNWAILSTDYPALGANNTGSKPITFVSRANIQTVGMSLDATTIFCGAYQGQLYTSRDFGSTFTLSAFNEAPQIYDYRCCSVSSNGNVIIAGNATGGNPHIVKSVNGGMSWFITLNTSADWRNVYVTPDGSRAVAAEMNIFSYGYSYSNFSTLDLATSLIQLEPSWSYKMLLPPATDYPGKQITFVKNSDHMIQFLSPQSTVIHTLSNTFVQLVAGSSNWLTLGNDSGFYSNTYYINNLYTTNYTNNLYGNQGVRPQDDPFGTNILLQNPQVITDLAVFPGFLSGYEISSIVYLSNTNSVQASTIEASSFFFQTSLNLPLTISSQALLYNGNNYTQSIAGEIMQTFTA